MAEDRRFCENCEAEIAQTANFCPNCGVRQSSGPEAPSGASASGTPPAGIPETGPIDAPTVPNVPPPPPRGRSRVFLFVGGGCVVLLLILLVLFVGCAAMIGSGGKGSSTTATATTDNQQTTQAPASDTKGQGQTKQASASRHGEKTQGQKAPTVSMGQTATVGDGSWVVNSAQPTTQLASQFGSQSKRGNFVVVDFTFTNNGNEAKTLSQPIFALYDSSNRKSSPDTDTFSYIPNEKDIFLNQVNPGVSKDGEVIFSVAPNASGFKLELSDTNYLNSGKAYVDLGF